ncbi:hypothetical protein RFI_20383, partial [Reticulomyxa filosa]
VDAFLKMLCIWIIIASVCLLPSVYWIRKYVNKTYCSKIDFDLWIKNKTVHTMELWLSFGYQIDWERVNEVFITLFFVHGRNYLHSACMGDSAEVVKLLFDYGALNIFLFVLFKKIKLDEKSKNTDIVDLLLKKGADPTLRTKKGHDAVRLTVVLNETDILQKLFDFENEKEEMEEIIGSGEEEEEVSGPLNERKYHALRKKEREERQRRISELMQKKRKEKKT